MPYTSQEDYRNAPMSKGQMFKINKLESELIFPHHTEETKEFKKRLNEDEDFQNWRRITAHQYIQFIRDLLIIEFGVKYVKEHYDNGD